MLPCNHPDRIQITFDDHRLVANAGLVLPATLARRLDLPELVHNHLDLRRATGRANTGDKMMTLVASALAGGGCIAAAGVLRTGGAACTLGGMVKAPSTLGTFLRSFRWGHVRQLDRVSRELPARAWQAGAGPGDAPFTIDLDSTICWVTTRVSPSTTRSNSSRRPPRSFLAPLASSARIFPREQPARTSRSTCRSRFLSSGSLTETLA